MKIVIVSDTHGSRKNIENVCECNPDADMLIHLGDVEDDADYIEAIFECPTHIVGGNNDFFSRLPREEEFELEGHHIFITHGHAYYVSIISDAANVSVIGAFPDTSRYPRLCKDTPEVSIPIVTMSFIKNTRTG